MEFFQTAEGIPFRLGVLPGTFNPVTVAHLALAQAALAQVDEILFVLPHAFPHKPYSGASFEQRVSMLTAALRHNPSFSIAASQGGLFAEIAAECRSVYRPDTRLTFLCGRDAAERIAAWDYGQPGAFDTMLRQFDLLVAARAGEYQIPPQWSSAIARLELPGLFDHVSATEVRGLIARADPWEHLVPPEVRAQVREIYSQRG
jgi:nicotinate-nucleotide adenylyltransferase